jgi:hypothetical protein
MTLKTATLVALIGVGMSYGMGLIQGLQHHAFGIHLIQGGAFQFT